MAIATVYNFVRMTCAPLQSDVPTNTSEKIAFYSYRGADASQFSNLRAADTNGDGQLDFVIGVSDANYRKFLKLDGSVFAQGSQKNPILWGDPVHVARSALQLQCQTMHDSRTTHYLVFAGTTLTGIAILAESAALVVSVASTSVVPGFLVLAGLLVIHGGFMVFGNKLDTVEDTFNHSLNALFPSF